MSGSTIIFYLLAVLTLGSGLLAVTSRQIFRSAIYLLFSLIGVAGLYFWLQYEIYCCSTNCSVCWWYCWVLIIFSIFLTQQTGEKLPQQKIGQTIVCCIGGLLRSGVNIIATVQI